MTRTPSPADRKLIEIKPIPEGGAADIFYNGRLIGLVYREHGSWYGLTARTGRTTFAQTTRAKAVDELWFTVLAELDG